jgi:hypothetical protein
MGIDRNILKITITELRHSCDVVERCVRDYGIDKPVSWRWEADEVSRYIWNDACMRVKNPKGLRPFDAAGEIAALALQEGVIIEAQPNGSLVLRPTRMQIATDDYVQKKIVESFQADLGADGSGPEIPRDLEAGSCRTPVIIAPDWGLFHGPYRIGARYDGERPLSSLRPFAQMILHSQILHQCLVSDSGQMQRARSFYADERVSDELRSFIDGTIPVVDLIGSPEEGAMRSIFCWLWSGTYPRKLFLELVTQRPQWRWCSLGRDLMLPPEAEVSLKVFEDKSAVWGLLLLLSSSIPGVDLAPLCALFKEEANIPWYVRTTLQRLMKVREELEQSAAMDFDSSINIMIDDDFSEAIFLLASLDYEAVRHTSSLYLSYYIERVWNVTKAVNVVLAGRVCNGKLSTYESRYGQFLDLALRTLSRHATLLGIDTPGN